LTNLKAWWEHEIGTLDELLFQRKCESHGFDPVWLTEQLFDKADSKNGRLRWRKEINGVDVLLSILYRSPDEVKDFIAMFRETREEKQKFLAYLGLSGFDHDFTPEFAQRILETVNQSASIFSLQLLVDWLWAGRTLEHVDAWDFRINCPGVVCMGNWNLIMPFSLEELLKDPTNPIIRSINEKTQRLG
jgi:4-alpha-glucanotransferase